MSQSSLRVEAYCEVLESHRKAKSEGAITPAVEDLMLDQLDELWNELTVDDCVEVERRYPELRLRKFG